jgi:guanylate kinase
LSSATPSSTIARRGLLLVLSSPSGAGKTTLSRRLLEREDELVMSVSVTTRKPRPGEVDGKDYHFISREQFDRMVENRRVAGTRRRFRQRLRHAAEAR